MVISALDNNSVHRITSGQVAVDLATCVKELVENSVDASARTVEVRFKNHGLDGTEVVDNGDGISDDDLNSVALKHHTSKIRQFDDLETVETFGFRGEAMSSLCALCDVMMITCCASAVPKATQLSFGHDGNVVSKTMVSGVKGTSVRLENIFKTLPVRRKEFEKTHKREFSKAVDWIQAYAIAVENVKLTVTHVLPSKRKSVLFSTTGGSMKQNIATVYGASVLDTLLAMDMKVEWTSRSIIGRLENLGRKDKEEDGYEDREMRLKGYISKPIFGMGRNSKDRQLFFVNSRPCMLPQLSKAINELYKMYNTVQYPIVIADLKMDPRCYDVNVTPDKRTILLNSEETIIEKIKEQLGEFFEQAGHSVPSNETVNGLSASKPPAQQTKLSFLEKFRSDEVPRAEKSLKDSILLVEEEEEEEEENKTIEENGREEKELMEEDEQEKEPEPSPPPKKLSDEIKQARIQHIRQPRYFAPSSSDTNEDDEEDNNEPSKYEQRVKRRKVEKKNMLYKNVRAHNQNFSSSLQQFVSSSQRDSDSHNDVPEPGESEVGDEDPNIPIEINSSVITEVSAQQDDIPITQHEDEGPGLGDSSENISTIRCDHDHQHAQSEEEPEEDEEELPPPQQRTFANFVRNSQRQKYHYNTKVNITLSDIRAGAKRVSESGNKFTKDNNDLTTGIHKSDIQQEAEEAERLLNLTIKKDDFTKMKVIGQFNKGFILVTKKKVNKSGKDMFIVDQHASDEKFNFERLQRDTMIKKQPLVVSRPLQLSAVDEITLTSNLDIVSKNGFGISVDEGGVPGSKCKLASLPLSKTTVFNEKDLEELIYLIQEAPGNESIRCSKVRAMFASRACRSSIMIGQSLTTQTMQRVVKNLAGLDKPWNCPHGRPTLRHLTTMDHFVGFIDDIK